MREFHQHLGVGAWTPQRLKHFRHLLDANYVSDHWLWLDFSGGEGVDSFGEV